MKAGGRLDRLVRGNRAKLTPDRARMDAYGLSERQLFDSIGALLGGQTVGYAPRGDGRDPLPIRIALDQAQRSWSADLAATPVASMGAGGRLVQLGDERQGR